jgi:hypothetical protein
MLQILKGIVIFVVTAFLERVLTKFCRYSDSIWLDDSLNDYGAGLLFQKLLSKYNKKAEM